MKTYKITYSETYTGETEIEAESNEEAREEFNRIVAEEGLDSLGIRLEMSDSSITAEEKPEELELNDKEREILEYMEDKARQVHDNTAFCYMEYFKMALQYEAILPYVFPHEPTDGWHYWTDGDTVYAATEAHANELADILDMFADATTGYYDPEEDEKSGTVTKTTGWWYVSIE